MGIFNSEGTLITEYSAKGTVDILVASSEASDSIKSSADYVCTGTNDELVIQQAINYIATSYGGKLRFSEGRFYIDSFPNTDTAGDYVALLVPQKSYKYSIEFIGAMMPYGVNNDPQRGSQIRVSDACYESLSSSSKYTVIRGGYVASPEYQNSNLHMTVRNLSIQLPWNQKKITCLDFFYTNRVFVDKVYLHGYRSGYDGHTVDLNNPPAVAVEGCVGLKSVSGANSGVLIDYRNIASAGFYEGFKLGGEHVIGINLSAIRCVYGYTFGNYTYGGNMVHPMTFINCCDEQNVNLPYFVKNGNTSTNRKQAITFIDFNMERYASATPGGALGDLAKEATPGAFYGTINYTLGQWAENRVDMPFWESGHGHNFVSRNDAQALAGTSAVRRTYAPNYMQAFYDTTVNKMLWCINPANKTWIDAQGNTVA